MLKQRLSLKLLQKISPQQIQFVKLLQVPTVNLEGRIKEELQTNPALEEDENPEGKELLNPDQDNKEQEEEKENRSEEDFFDSDNLNSKTDKEFSLDDYIDREGSSYKTSLPSSQDEEVYEAPIRQYKSLYDLLLEQLGMLDLDARLMTAAEHLVGSIDEDGYLRRPLPLIANDLLFRYNIHATPEEVESVLKQIQRFDPPGIGARDLQECLILQLNRIKQDNDVKIAIKMLTKYFNDFSKKHFSRLKEVLKISDSKLKKVYSLITHLNPKPGESETDIRHKYIIPDFSLTIEEGKINVKLNGRNAPDLKVSRSYLKMMEEYSSRQKKKSDPKIKETLEFVRQKIESAQWFIDALKQRQFTLLNTMYAIAEKQTDFFLSGGDEKKLKPMILQDVAKDIELDISTISRVANSKYVQTENGIYPLKFFFSEGITKDSGEEVSNKEVKKIVKDLINNENKKKPLSDDKLTEFLHEKGFKIARRTVSKYREQLNFPSARMRKEM